MLSGNFKVEQFLHSCQRRRYLPACHSLILPRGHLARMEEGRQAGVSAPGQQALPESARLYRASRSTAALRRAKASSIPSNVARAAQAEGLLSVDGRGYLSALSTAAFRVGQEPTPNPRSALAVFGGVLKVTCKGKNKNGFVPHLLLNNA